jgi:hypothetical protein
VVTENNTVKVSFAVTPAGCFNETIGAIDITPSGGTAPYTYSWQHGPTTEDLTGLASGIYRITVTDQVGCSILTAINVPRKSIQVNAQVDQPLCSGDSTGSITIVPIDGSTTYVYHWSTGDSTNSISNVPIGDYTVTITDASGCSRTLSYSITQPSSLESTVVVSNNNCGVEGSFSIDLSVASGKPPYTYLWSTGNVQQDLQNLNSGTYSVQITDANGCTATKEVVISPASDSYTCDINPESSPIICGSAGNTLTAVTTDAQSYQWSVSSSDSSWLITSGGTSSALFFTAGTPGSTSTFTLTIQKDGCVKTCTHTIAAGCEVRDNNGGGDPSTGDPCDSTIVNPPPPPPDPTEDPEPGDVEFEFTVYPNPFVHTVTFEWTADRDDRATLVIMDRCGKIITRVFSGNVVKGEKYTVEWEGERLRDRLYFYRFISSTQSKRGKLFRK